MWKLTVGYSSTFKVCECCRVGLVHAISELSRPGVKKIEFPFLLPVLPPPPFALIYSVISQLLQLTSVPGVG